MRPEGALRHSSFSDCLLRQASCAQPGKSHAAAAHVGCICVAAWTARALLQRLQKTPLAAMERTGPDCKQAAPKGLAVLSTHCFSQDVLWEGRVGQPVVPRGATRQRGGARLLDVALLLQPSHLQPT